MGIGKIMFNSFDKVAKTSLVESTMRGMKCREKQALSFIYEQIERLSQEDLELRAQSRPGYAAADMPAHVQQAIDDIFAPSEKAVSGGRTP